ncbi:MAG: Uma2 family endonuclease [Planctomyces sp.]|nr:Uma2 family endonuclease [Planctomyces sp.]
MNPAPTQLESRDLSSLSTATTPEHVETWSKFGRKASSKGEPTWELVHQFPIQGDWSLDDYLALKTHVPIEFNQGVLEFLDMPSAEHQLITFFLQLALFNYLRQHPRGVVLAAPIRLKLNENLVREPDLMVLPGIDSTRTPFVTSPLLVVEILSEGAMARDRDEVKKRGEYEAAGIPEYWIIDPLRSEFRLFTRMGDKEGYSDGGVFRAGDAITSVIFDGLSIDVGACFKAGLDGRSMLFGNGGGS